MEAYGAHEATKKATDHVVSRMRSNAWRAGRQFILDVAHRCQRIAALIATARCCCKGVERFGQKTMQFAVLRDAASDRETSFMALLLLFQGGLEPLRAFRPGHTQSSASEGADGSATILG